MILDRLARIPTDGASALGAPPSCLGTRPEYEHDALWCDLHRVQGPSAVAFYPDDRLPGLVASVAVFEPGRVRLVLSTAAGQLVIDLDAADAATIGQMIGAAATR